MSSNSKNWFLMSSIILFIAFAIGIGIYFIGPNIAPKWFFEHTPSAKHAVSIFMDHDTSIANAYYHGYQDAVQHFEQRFEQSIIEYTLPYLDHGSSYTRMTAAILFSQSMLQNSSYYNPQHREIFFRLLCDPDIQVADGAGSSLIWYTEADFVWEVLFDQMQPKDYNNKKLLRELIRLLIVRHMEDFNDGLEIILRISEAVKIRVIEELATIERDESTEYLLYLLKHSTSSTHTSNAIKASLKQRYEKYPEEFRDIEDIPDFLNASDE